MVKKKKQTTGKDASVNLQKVNDLFPSDPKELQALEKIYALLLKTSQVDFSQYRDTTVLRRLNRRMSLCNQDSYADYFKFLKKNPAETEQLFYDLLLSYTHFFRDGYIFDTLKKEVFPNLVKKHPARKPVRIWIPGCSSGEEVYSIAICLYEFMEDNNIKIHVEIFGTDLVEQHIEKARSGLYNDKIRDEVSEERLERFFDKTPEGLKVSKHIREMCVFAAQDITQDPPFPNMDLISCRNVLIYFDTAYQDAAIPRFHFSLNPEGYLLLGSSETMGRYPELFNVVDKKSNLYSKRLTADKPAYHFPVTQKATKLKDSAAAVPGFSAGRTNTAAESAQMNKILLDAYAPPGVFVNSSLQILQFIGNTHPYLSPVSVEASLKLPRMAGDTLMPDIYMALEQAKKKKDKIRKKHISFKHNDRMITIDLCVIPVPEANSKDTHFLILFEETEAPPADSPLPMKMSAKDRTEVDHLKQELLQTKKHLQSIIEEKDAVNQELRVANEDIMSTNEELQSVNEDMEASKEELESGNEELLALNEELQMKNITIAESEEKQRLLLQNIHAGVVVHAPDTSILMANNRACEILGLTIDQMMGKTAIDPAWKFLHQDGTSMPQEEYPVNQVIAKQETVSFLNSGVNRPQTNDIAWVLIHAFPEMKKDGTLSQVVVTFVDITERKKAENALREGEKKFSSYVQNAPVGIFVVDEQGRYLEVNSAASAITGYSAEEFRSMRIPDLLPPQALSAGEQHFKQVVRDGHASGENLFIHKSGEIRNWIVDAVRLSPTRFMGYVQDITKRKDMEKALKESETKFKNIFENKGTATGTFGEDSIINECNAMFENMCGYPKSEIIDKMKWSDFVIKEDLERLQKYNSQRQKNENSAPVKYECRLLNKKGGILSVIVNVGMVGKNRIVSIVDITERKQAEEELAKHREHLEELVNDRTSELEKRNKELENIHKNIVGREFRIKELRDQVKDYKARLGED